MTHKVLENGLYNLSGVGSFTEYDDCTGENIETIVLILDDKYYVISEDPSDGNRSYGIFRQISDIPKNSMMTKFPPQKVLVENEYINKVTDDWYNEIRSSVKIYNSNDNSLISEIGTNYSNDYYPCAIFRWYPQNLPINK